MYFNFRYFLLAAFIFSINACTSNQNSNSKKMSSVQIMEVTTFKIKSGVDASVFNTRDAGVEADFTSKQPGFIKRISGITEDGTIGVIVFWESNADADASMSKFMKDASVADYGAMIDAGTMKMARYSMDKSYDAAKSEFIEVMTYNLNDGIDYADYVAINDKVEKEVTGPKPGFIQRMIGQDDKANQVVAIFWDNKQNSDAALQPFMNNPISKEFMGMMQQSTIWMGRFQTLKSL